MLVNIERYLSDYKFCLLLIYWISLDLDEYFLLFF